MSVTVRDVLKLPCMRDAEVIAGSSGLDNIVTAVSVLEYSSYSEDQDRLFDEQDYEGSDIVITAFSSLMDDHDKILAEMKASRAVGEAGVIIYYFDLFVKELDQKVIDFADEEGYPIILMPRDQYQLRYSEAISEISELILEDRKKTEYFSSFIMETFLALPKNQQNISALLRLLSNYLHLTFILTEKDWKLRAFAGWPKILERDIEGILNLVLEGERSETSEMILFDEIPGRKLHLAIVGSEPLKKSIVEQTGDVIRLYLKMNADDSIENIGSEQLIRAIIGDEPMRVRKLAKNQGIDAGKLRNMIVFQEPHIGLPQGDVILKEVRDLLGRYCHDHVTDVYSGNVVAFLDDGISSQWLPALNSLSDSIREKGMKPICVYARNLDGPAEMRDAYLNVTAHMDDARVLYRKASIVSYREIMFVSELKDIISQGEEAVKKELGPLKYIGVRTEGQSEELIETLSSFYFDSHMSVTETAENLFIHINTVKYRLRKISEMIGCRVTEMPEMLELYKALAIKRLMQS